MFAVEPAIATFVTISGVPKPHNFDPTPTERLVMITVSKLALTIAVAGPLAAATVGESSATPLSSSPVAAKAAASTAATDVQYRGYDYGPYTYRPYGGYPYPYGGYTYWYPAYPYWDPNTWNTGNGYY
jgi:hypothetical protein